MSPALINIITAVLSVVYVFAVVAVMDFFVKKGFPQHISRKVVHICAGSWLIFWIFFEPNHWTKYLNIAPAAVWFILLLIKGFTAAPDDDAVKTMTRTGDRKELLKGPLYFTIVMMIMGTVFFDKYIAAVSMGILGFGDGLAPLFGKYWGKHKFTIFTEKTFEGSLSFLFFGILGASILSFILFGEVRFYLIITATVVSTIIEAFSPKDIDNLLIPVVCLLIFYII